MRDEKEGVRTAKREDNVKAGSIDRRAQALCADGSTFVSSVARLFS